MPRIKGLINIHFALSWLIGINSRICEIHQLVPFRSESSSTQNHFNRFCHIFHIQCKPLLDICFTPHKLFYCVWCRYFYFIYSATSPWSKRVFGNVCICIERASFVVFKILFLLSSQFQSGHLEIYLEWRCSLPPHGVCSFYNFLSTKIKTLKCWGPCWIFRLCYDLRLICRSSMFLMIITSLFV